MARHKANAAPAGGGGGGWAEMNRKMAESAEKRRAKYEYKPRGAGHIEGGLAYGAMTMSDGVERTITGTSIFDPVLCELNYRWFCPPGGLVLDPFAGGSVRGLVAVRLGRRYLGVDLRPEQVEANQSQAQRILQADDPRPTWVVGDSVEIDRHCAGVEADFIFSCPPYADLEVYSDDPRDLSTMDYADFRAAYRSIVAKSCALLRPDRFAAFVVGEVRDKRGNYYGFVPDTIAAFRDAGLDFYNEAILVTAAGSLPIRAGKQFETTRKLGKTHQNLLVFVKGSAKAATQAIGPVEFGAFEEISTEGGLTEAIAQRQSDDSSGDGSSARVIPSPDASEAEVSRRPAEASLASKFGEVL